MCVFPVSHHQVVPCILGNDYISFGKWDQIQCVFVLIVLYVFG